MFSGASIKKYWAWFTTDLYSGESTILMKLVLAGLYSLGTLHWLYFFRRGNLRLFVLDWLKERSYLEIWRAAIINGQIPYTISTKIQETQNFMANPEVVLTPDIYLLRWASDGTFVLFHVLLFYSLGFIGLVIIQRRFKLSPISVSLFFILFFLNGHITSHFGIGHFQWTGYFLLTIFAALVMHWLDISLNKSFELKSIIWMSLLIFLLYLNGSFHMANWSIMFLGFLTLSNFRLIKYFLTSLVISFGLVAHRLVPAFYSIRDLDRTIYAGYPSIEVFANAFTKISGYDLDRIGVTGWGKLWWWEYDFYIGIAGAIFLLIGVVQFIVPKSNTLIRKTSIAVIAMGVLSIGTIYGELFRGVLTDIERVPSRFLVIPFIILLLAAAVTIDQWLKLFRHKIGWIVGLLMGTIVYQITPHSILWRVALIERDFLFKKYSPTIQEITIIGTSDQTYQLLVITTTIISLVFLAGALIALVYLQKRRGDEFENLA